MNADPTFDRRKYLRVKTESLVSIGRLDAHEGLAHALDMSLGGIRFQCVGMDVKVGDMLKVTLTLEQDTTTVLGQLVRVADLDEFTQEVALCFVKMGNDTHERLAAYLPPAQDSDWPDDRRRYSRMALESVVSVARADVNDIVAQARDLSLGGIRFLVEGMDLELGGVLRVTLQLADTQVTVIGQLVRITEIDEFREEVALAFLEVDPESLHLMQQYLPAADET